MDDIIRLLPESVSSRIAAGEVVQRPASVVKEMTENAIDAGARSVRILLTDAGRTLIQIIDDGCGMSAADAVLAFKRHATSKISTAEELYELSTFGFRGEALASIAAVAEVRLQTRRDVDETGIMVEVRGEEMLREEPVSCPKGCNFEVRNLFYNLPARRKFLKSNQTELSNILKEIERISLSHPEIAITVWHQGSEILSLQPSAVKQRIIGLFGSSMNKVLLPLQTETSAVSVSGFVSTLDGVRKRGAEQFFFVNSRYMRHPYFHRAVLEPYENLVPQQEQPSYFIFLTVPPDTIDVNIHPTKTEIKFSEEQLVWKILNAAVREALGRYEGATSIDFDTEGMPDIPIACDNISNIRQPKVSYNPSFNPFDNISEKPRNSGNGQWTRLFQDVLDDKVREQTVPYATTVSKLNPDTNDSSVRSYRYFQYGNRCIVTYDDRGVMIIDQHRAHICSLYKNYCASLADGSVASQGLLFPEMLQLSPSDAALLADYGADMRALGFDLSDMGHGAIAIQSVPYGLDGADYEKLLTEMLHSASQYGELPTVRRKERLALSLSRSAAVPDGKALSDSEINDLLLRFDACGKPSRTPDGKVVYILLEDADITTRL